MPATDLLETLGRVVLTFQSAPHGVPGRIWDEVRPWLANLVKHAAPKWLPRLSFGFACTLPRPDGYACPRPAVAACDACGRPCCLDHARIDQWGDAICYACCWEIGQQKRSERAAGGGPHAHAQPPHEHAHAHQAPNQPPPIPEKELTWARRTLGVKKSDEWADVQSAYKRLLAKWHPDRHPNDAATAEKKFKDVRRAFDLLTQERERKEAA
jgi:hypothetical protein